MTDARTCLWLAATSSPSCCLACTDAATSCSSTKLLTRVRSNRSWIERQGVHTIRSRAANREGVLVGCWLSIGAMCGSCMYAAVLVTAWIALPGLTHVVMPPPPHKHMPHAQ